MGLIINTQIGTNRGITDEGYVRIEKYEVDTYNGFLRVYPNLYLSSASAAEAKQDEWVRYSAVENRDDKECASVQLKNEYLFPLTSSEVRTRYEVVSQTVSSSVETMVPNPDGPGEVTSSHWEYDNQEVSQSIEYTASVIDTSHITGSSIYEFAYPLLKAELAIEFGVGNILDDY